MMKSRFEMAKAFQNPTAASLREPAIREAMLESVKAARAPEWGRVHLGSFGQTPRTVEPELRAAILSELEDGPTTMANVAASTGYTLGVIRYAMAAMRVAGDISSDNASERGKRASLWFLNTATPAASPPDASGNRKGEPSTSVENSVGTPSGSPPGGASG